MFSVNLIEKSKLIALLNRILNQVGKQTTDDEISYICPFHTAHNNVTRKKFGISLDGQYHCFACGAAGKSFKTLFKKLKAKPSDYKELYSIIGDYYKPTINKPHEKKSTDLQLPPEFIPIKTVQPYSILYKHAVYYLKKRGITRDDILRYNIGYCERGLYRNRIIIPSYDKNGDLNFFSARDFLNTSKLKYLLPKWSKDIIGFELFINWSEAITIVESAFNAITIRKNSIPLFGKTMSDELKEAILENDVSQINVCLDKDAEQDSIRMCEDIRRFTSDYSIKIHFVELPLKDPNEIGFEKMNTIINNSSESDFEFLYKKRLMYC